MSNEFYKVIFACKYQISSLDNSTYKIKTEKYNNKDINGKKRDTIKCQ